MNVDYIIRLRDQFTNTFNKFRAGANAADKKIDEINSRLGKMNQLMGGIAVGALGAGLLATTAKMEGLRKSIVFASGSAEEGSKNLKFIDDTANSLGLDVAALSEGFRTLSGATMGTSLAGKQTRETFEAVSQASAVMGLSAEQTEGALLALGQMVSKGTVSAEELRGQLGERLPGAFNIAAKAMGVTTAKLGDMMKNGEVAATEFLPKFAAELKKTYGGGLAEATDSINAQTAALKNLWTQFAIKMVPVMKMFMKGLVGVATWLQNNTSAVYAIVAAIGALVTMYGYLKLAQIAVALTNPFVAMVVGITAAVAALAYLYNEFEGVRFFMNGLYEFFATIFKSIAEMAVNSFKAISEAIKGNFSEAAEHAKAAMMENLKLISGVTLGEAAVNSVQNADGENRIKGSLDKLFAIKESLTGGGANMGMAANSDTPGGEDGKKKKSKKLDKTIGEIAGGKPSSIVINIDSLIKENQNIVNNIKSPSDLKDFEKMLINCLVRVTNDAQIAIG